ncbi:proline iminopeptidase [Phanerochaete sordida]|uniref:Proline iminopeptidase n=1 Tax=Phanerochaete sordida TaxID=48140 RepID=A0A9P3G881_9APHY|nr:proline iminopeptidase [Phanerochaete sordida]
MAPPVTEGEAPFRVPGVDKPCATWYKVVGDLKASKKLPLVTLHGGPGFAHDYLLPLVDLAGAPYDTPVVFYDQLGGGRSTHLPEKKGDEAFWSEQLFEDEFYNLLKHLGIVEYDLLGHSWGGMLAERIATKHPKGLRRLVLTDSLANMKTWAESARKLLAKLPKEIQDAVEKHDKNGTTEDPEYQAAIAEFFKAYVLRVDPWPAEFLHVLELYEKDPTVYHTMLGPSEFNITGSLKNWDIIKELHKINVPTLVLNGRHDEATDEVVAPLFWHIPKVRWYTFPDSSHMPYWEEREAYMKFVAEFLE